MLLDKDEEHDPEKIDSYIYSINIPTIDPITAELIDRPLTREEIEKAIKNLKNNNSPGSDGFTNEFYKNFIDIISRSQREHIPMPLRKENC